MKRKYLCLIMTVLLIGILIAGCGGADEETAAPVEEGVGPAQSDTAQEGDFSQNSEAASLLTSIEAAKLAYGEAVKWRSDAVLWGLQPVPATLDAGWAENDLAGEWIAMFACASDDRCFSVDIKNGAVVSASEESYETRETDIPDALPKDRPGVSMRDAAQTALENGMPEHPMNVLIAYNVEHYTEEWNGRAIWEFDYPTSDAAYCYAVDGLTGELIDIRDQNDNSIDPSQMLAGQEKPSGDATEVIGDFFELLNQGKTEEALALMSENTVGNSQSREMWISSLEGIESVSLEKTEEFLTDSWSDTFESYKCTLSLELKSDAQPGLWEEGEIVRFFSMQAENGEWKILGISANP
ncbi:MAG TPA: hypothetical protein PKV62_00630 [Oscillospiraceae bacterium]|nr:hypothetical protein [Oscillospiraceae bacterium]